MVHLCTIAVMAKRSFKWRVVPKPGVDPEIVAFLTRTNAVGRALNISHYTLSKRLFNEQARALENLADGKGANVVGWMRAKRLLADMESELQAVSA